MPGEGDVALFEERKDRRPRKKKRCAQKKRVKGKEKEHHMIGKLNTEGPGGTFLARRSCCSSEEKKKMETSMVRETTGSAEGGGELSLLGRGLGEGRKIFGRGGGRKKGVFFL